MDIETCFKILKYLKSVSFATVDEYGNPQVRIIDVMHVTSDDLYFITARGKNFYHELMSSGKVCIVGFTPGYQSIRINAKVCKVKNQQEWLNRILELNPDINSAYPRR